MQRLVAISGCGHLPHEECPKALLAAVLPFIALCIFTRVSNKTTIGSTIVNCNYGVSLLVFEDDPIDLLQNDEVDGEEVSLSTIQENEDEEDSNDDDENLIVI
ncbi:unnamed protein product [Lathyrus sativus]|nr:unnamed protein product [Lathyrus sativus]